MLPESSSLPPTATIEQSTEQTTTSTQHGLLRDDLGAVSPPHFSAEKTSAEEQSALDTAIAASLQEANRDAGKRDSAERGLNARSTPSPPARNRILEYEQASTPPMKKREGPAFEVIKKPRSPGDKRAPILDLPNGKSILQHVEDGPC